jgi:A/G-specific adenine glycosylase
VTVSQFTNKLLIWYRKNARQMPWRGQTDAYAVWVSEIMLQQTQVETVTPYYQRWMARFPDVAALAKASLQEVLSVWEGLGYYSRARNLHQAASIVMEQYGGRLPVEVDELKKLPGIGKYTAGALASIAFGQDQPALDGNVRRVLSRFFKVDQPLGTSAAEKRLRKLALAQLPPGQAGVYNQALMDLGALICTPRTPDCPRCPVKEDCLAYGQGLQDRLPVKRDKSKIPHHTVAAAVIRRDGRVLIAQRPLQGLLGGMWEFPGGKLQPGEDLVSCLQREIREELGVDVEVSTSLGTYRHAYTHYRVTLQAFDCALPNGDEPQPTEHQGLRWVPVQDLGTYPMGKIDRRIADRIAARSGETEASN